MQLDSESILIEPLDLISEQLSDSIIEWALEKLSFTKTEINIDEQSLKALLTFDSHVTSALVNNPTYKTSVTKFVQSLPRVKYLVLDFQTFFNDIKFIKNLVSPNEKLVVNEIIEALTGNGLNAGFIQPLRDLIYRQIAAGSSQRQLTAIIKEWVIGDKNMGHFGSYVTQTAQTAVDAYPAMINKKLMQTFDYPYLLMTGSLIKTSSPQCRRVVNVYDGVISRKTWSTDIEPLADRNGLINNTNFDNVTFNKLHWGCRHEFTPLMNNPFPTKTNENNG